MSGPGRPRITLGSPLPITPKKQRGGALEDLLQQFGSQSSATSATKARRVSSFSAPKCEQPTTANGRELDSKRQLRQLPALDYAVSNRFTTKVPKTTSSSLDSPDDEDPNQTEMSEDELVRSVRPTRFFKKPARRSHTSMSDELKMEHRRKGRNDAPRRSTRGGKGNILESDTFQDHLAPAVTRHKAPSRRKLDTVRQRLRDDIAQRSKTKANNFLIANKDYFLPLLPKHNSIARLVATHEAGPIVQYEELTCQPKGVMATMKPYQLSGLSFLVHLYNNGFSGILGDEMGLGKTLQTLSLFQYLEEHDRKSGVTSEELRPYLVVCPLSVLNSWVSEAQKWVPELKVLRFHGTTGERSRLKKVAMGIEDRYGNETFQSKDRKASRKAGKKVSKLPTDYQGSDSYKIVVTTYETFQAEQAWFKHSFVWRYVVLDEGHRIKSSVAQISHALKNVGTEYRLILTGTPLQNDLVEMWALLAWLYPDVFTENTGNLFKESFDLNRGKVNRQTMDDARRLLELIMLRRMKDSPGVNLGLPPKEEMLLYVPLTPMQKFWYTRLLTRVDGTMLDELFANNKSKEKSALEKEKQDNELFDRMAQLDQEASHGSRKGGWEETATIMRQALEQEQANTDTRIAWQKLMNLVMQLRKCCSHPYLLPGAAPDPYYLGDHVIHASGKFLLLEKLLKYTILEQGKKVLIFSGFTRTLDCCEDLLSLVGNHGRDFKYLRLDGGTARARRNLDIRMFNDPNSAYKVMLLSTRAGGLGINLTSAEDVIFLDEDWNPQITLQAEARAHRIGQTKKVTIYKLCTQGTVEEQMMGRIRKKLYLSTKVTESMRNINGGNAAKIKGRPSLTEDMPQMDTSQLKTLVRRGAQALSHPEINVTDMLSWDLETMMQKCRDKPANPQADAEASHTAIDEEEWLSVMERVECAVFEGKRYQRQLDTTSGTSAKNILPESISREDRRKGKNTTVMVDGYVISKESHNCADWEAVPTMAGKDPRLAEVKREKRPQIQHEEHCVACFDGPDSGHIVECKSCPRTYHFDCLEPVYQAKVKGFAGFYCPQHNCLDCGKNTTDAGGLIFRCRWCPRGFCEDCLDWDETKLLGGNLPEFEMLGEGDPPGGFFIACPNCIKSADDDENTKAWIDGMEADYKQQYKAWVGERDEQQRQLEKEQGAIRKKDNVKQKNQKLSQFKEGGYCRSFDVDVQEDSTSPPAMTNSSLPTPTPDGSGVSTPKFLGFAYNTQSKSKKRTQHDFDEELDETREGKRTRSNRKKLDDGTRSAFRDYSLWN